MNLFSRTLNVKFTPFQQGCTIVSACGFDSIPADLGLAFMVSKFPKGAIPSAAESYLSLQAGEMTAI